MNYQAIVLASGNSTRSNLNYNKVLYKINGITIIEKSLSNFLADDECINIILVVKEDEMHLFKDLIKDKKVIFTVGGKLRQDSVNNGLKLVTEDYVLIHDGARPYFSKELLDNIKLSLKEHDACIPAVEVKDTIKEVLHNKVVRTLKRPVLRMIQTPQAFKTSLIKKAYKINKQEVTDDASLIENMNEEVYIVKGERTNVKFTYEEEFNL